MDFFIVDDKNIVISQANKNDIGTKLNLPQNFEGVILKTQGRLYALKQACKWQLLFYRFVWL